MNINNQKIFSIYILLYLSILIGNYFNEDLAYGAIHDYLIHKKNAEILKDCFLKRLPM